MHPTRVFISVKPEEKESVSIPSFSPKSHIWKYWIIKYYQTRRLKGRMSGALESLQHLQTVITDPWRICIPTQALPCPLLMPLWPHNKKSYSATYKKPSSSNNRNTPQIITAFWISIQLNWFPLVLLVGKILLGNHPYNPIQLVITNLAQWQ